MSYANLVQEGFKNLKLNIDNLQLSNDGEINFENMDITDNQITFSENLKIRRTGGSTVLRLIDPTQSSYCGVLLSGNPFSESGIQSKMGIMSEPTNTFNRGKLHLVQNNAGDNSSATPANAKLTIIPSGSVGINTVSPDPANALEVNGLTVSTGGFNSGTSELGGHSMLLKFDNGATISAPNFVGINNDGSGHLMPFSGKIVAVSVMSGQLDTFSVSVSTRNAVTKAVINEHVVNLSNERVKFDTGLSTVFSASNYINVQVGSGTATDHLDVAVYVVFD